MRGVFKNHATWETSLLGDLLSFVLQMAKGGMVWYANVTSTR